MPADIGLGILSALGTAQAFGVTASLEFMIGGIIFAILMDADFILHLLRGGNSKNAYRHREGAHYPLLYIPLGSLVVFFVGGAPWAVLFALASLLHFIHDSIGIGWGVPWLWPFSRNHYTFFYSYTPPNRAPFPQRLLYTWKYEEIDKLEADFGDPEWIRHIYGAWHPYAIAEYIIFGAAIILLFLVK